MPRSTRRYLSYAALAAAAWLALQGGLRLGLDAAVDMAGNAAVRVGALRLNPFSGVLTVRDLRLYRNCAEPAWVDEAEFNLSMLSLLTGRLRLESAHIKGGYLFIQRRYDGRLQVAGLPLPGGGSGGDGPPALAVDKVHIEGVRLDLFARSHHTRIAIDQLTLDGIDTADAKRQAPLKLTARLNDAPLTVEARLTLAPHPSLEGSLSASGLQVARLLRPWVAPLPLARGTLGANGLWALELGDTLVVHYRGRLQANALEVATDGVDLRGTTQWNGQVGLEQGGASTVVKLSGGLEVSDIKGNLQRMALTGRRLTWQGSAELRSGSKATRARVDGKAQAEGLTLDGRALSPELALGNSSLGLLQLDGIRVDWPRSLEVDTVKLGDLDVDLSRTAGTATAAAADDNAAPTLPMLRIGRLLGTSALNLHLHDKSIKPPLTKEVSISSLDLGPIDTGAPDIVTRLELAARIDEFSTLRLSGSASPLAAPPQFDLNGQLNDFELPPLSPYLVDTTGYRVDSGQLDVALKVRTDQNQLSGSAELTSRKPELTAVDDAQAEATRKKLAMPLPAALALLSDDRGTVHLTIPLSGDLTSPQFDIGDAIDQATTNSLRAATVGYLKYYFQPYGSLISLLQLAGEAITRIRLDPVVFAGGSTTLDDTARAYLDKVGQLMTDKEELVLRVCPVVTTRSEGRHSASLGHKRVNTVKEYLHRQQQIPAARLLSCQGLNDNSQTAQPRVELNLD